MSEEILVKQCAPTLAGLKTGNLFPCTYSDEYEMKESIRCWNKMLAKKGLRILPMRYRNGRALIYVYRPAKLNIDLKNGIAKQILKERGYCTKTTAGCVAHLVRRLCAYEEFPHEIGLFLGYPPEDVNGFVENKAGNCKCVGCWKVYGDVEAAQKVFAKFKKCTDVYWNQFTKGKTIERLTVVG